MKHSRSSFLSGPFLGVTFALWLCMTAAQAEMTEERSGKVIQGLGGRYGYERVSTFGSDLGESNFHFLHAGPVSLVLEEARISAPKYPSPASIGIGIGSRSASMNLQPQSLKWLWVGLVGAGAIGVGWWRRRIREARSPAKETEG